MSPSPVPPWPVTVRAFTQQFSSTPSGARLARRLVVHQLDKWGVPYDSPGSDNAALIVSELATNAATHGRVTGRNFEVRLSLDGFTLRIEVSDPRGERRPAITAPADDVAERGRGLLLVEALADRWHVIDRVPVGKTVCAELNIRQGAATAADRDAIEDGS
jgi:anti-sigma regulatory factor (Ser/Thr protein kinase)